MERSLSALLPVRNVESSLAGTVLEWFEVLPDLTDRLELIVVDDCSSDATIEVIDELSARYPQFRAIRHAAPQGTAAALRTAAVRSRNEALLFPVSETRPAIAEVRKLWTALREHDAVLGRSVADAELGSAAARLENRGGFWLGLRAPMTTAVSAAEPLTLDRAMRQMDVRWREIEIAGPQPPVALQRVASQARRLFSIRLDPPEQKVPAPPPGESKRLPKYLRRLRDFALGE